MLTEIEWWGGLIFCWGAAMYWLLQKESDLLSETDQILINGVFFSSAATLALYFYDLPSDIAMMCYLGLTALGILLLLVTLFVPTDDLDIELEVKKELALQRGEIPQEEDDSQDANEPKPWVAWLSTFASFAPSTVALTLGSFKAYPFIFALGWLTATS